MASNRVSRKNALSVAEAIKMFFKQERLSGPHNSYRISLAWDQASGAAKYTVKRFFREGRLYITVDSSVVRNQLSFQRTALIERMNSILKEDEMFISDDSDPIKELIIK